jgi:rhodanese-related sulfurtransferase
MNPLLLGMASVAVLTLCSCTLGQHAEAAAKPNPPRRKSVSTPVATPPVLPMSQRGKVTSISLTDAFSLQQSDGALIYDARPRFHYSLGHIPGAHSMPKGSCEEEILVRRSELDAAVKAKKTIIVYCTNFLCADARNVAAHLALNGYSSAVMSGGWESWKESGLPTE